ncbi:unnamed protein product [Amoebophrya sp. A25]|nr:unnamed protein product [Amoebophrya sp. A25]|eukprot:GSA25T00009565001.1
MRDVNQRLFGYASMQTALQKFYELREKEQLGSTGANSNHEDRVTRATQKFEAKNFVSASLTLQDCTPLESAMFFLATGGGGGATNKNAWKRSIFPTYSRFLRKICEIFIIKTSQDADPRTACDLQSYELQLIAPFDEFLAKLVKNEKLHDVAKELQVIAIPRDKHLWLDTAYISGTFGTHFDENSAAEEKRLAEKGTLETRLGSGNRLVVLDTEQRKVDNNYVATAKRLDIFPLRESQRWGLDHLWRANREPPKDNPFRWKQLRILPISAFADLSDGRLSPNESRKLHFLRLGNSAADVKEKLTLTDETYRELKEVVSRVVEAIRFNLKLGGKLKEEFHFNFHPPTRS